MKTSNYKLLKALSKGIAFTALASMLLVSCGKDNETNSNVVAQPAPGTSPVQPGVNPNVSKVAEIKANYSCTRRSDITFHTTSAGNNSYNQTVIGGQFQPGHTGGTVSNSYVGVSQFKDLIIVDKLTTGNQVTGFNITLSYCTANLSNGLPLISNARALTNFIAPQGIILDDDSGCSLGNVDAAKQTIVDSAPYQYLPVFKVYTSFSKHCGTTNY